MSYQVLARKWRPRNFATLVGQEHVVRALTHALNENRLHHAYLFTGTRGVGKTTIARILAKCLNCESGISATPCGTCSACLEIDSGRFVDLLEVDAATNTKVDEMRQLLENAIYAPTRGRFKVYVIDEVHMLSTSAFNAMLKTLEEPPEHVKFILATTDPQKIPVTVLSRCLQFNLKQMPSQGIVGHLSNILNSESIPFESDALGLLAHGASGSMRDALSLLDQAIAHGAGAVAADQVRDMLGVVDTGYLLTLLERIQAQDVDAVLNIAQDMADRSMAFGPALQELAHIFVRLQTIQLGGKDVFGDGLDSSRCSHLAQCFSPQEVQLDYQIVSQGRQELQWAPDEYAGFVMTLLRLLAFAPVQGAKGGQPIPQQVRGSVAPAPNPGRASDAPSSPRPESCVQVPAHHSSAPGNNLDWHDLVPRLGLTGMARNLALHCELRSLEGQECVFRLDPLHKHMMMKPAPDKLEQALNEYFQTTFRFKIELGELQAITPAAAAKEQLAQEMNAAVAAIEQDPFVQDVIEIFDATLVESSIKPLA